MTNLEYHTARWLQFEKQCALVLCERTPRWGHGQPDVLGVLPSRFILEIEIKRTMSDFRANSKKHHMLSRFCGEPEIAERYAKRAPKLFWFLVPRSLVEKVEKELPDFAGLLTVSENGASLDVVKKAPTNKDSERLSLKECSKLMRCAGNMMIAMMAGICNVRQFHSQDPHFMDDFYSEPQPDYSAGWDENGRWKLKPADYNNFQI